MNDKYAIGLGFSSACNMNCPFCYSKEKRRSGQDIDLEIWYRFFNKNAELIESINYGTGENTTSNDWYKLIKFIRTTFPSIRQALTTNGYLYAVQEMDAEKRKLIQHCIDEIDVSLDFGDAKKHNAYRGNNMAYKWAIGTLEFCREHSITPTIVTLGIDQTFDLENMEAIFDIAKKYRAKVRINLYRPVDKNSSIVPASLNKILDFFDWVAEKHTILSVSDPLFSSLLCGGETNPDPSGRRSFRITQDGNIYPSTYLLYDMFLMGNISSFDIRRDMKDNPGSAMLLNSTTPRECLECKYVNRCNGGVLDRRYIWYGNFDNRDPYCFIHDHEKLRTFTQNRSRLNSVHDGYLPTLFFEA